ncbi:glutathione peroxidase [Mesonia sp. MT50]|uniref:Glutathione peroxidase n=1 Tax=Mesonia profundi TaxID=3070998 RepID=A0ABU1A1H1_9FLAO|nr:glutathione peroxidase [Mesonia profundi]MDQ7917557.1 glutathione peroxidase [Mesonia profundi]
MSKFHTYQIASSSGEEIDFKDFKNKVVLVVNTATKCGLTPQFKELERLHQKYKDQGLVVIGFPCNQFMRQEPLGNEEMKSTCEHIYGVTFPLTEKVKVNGKNAHPIFNYLKSHLSGFLSSKIKWNFTKFLIDKDGKPFKRYTSTTAPKKMQKDIEVLLKM